AEQQRTQQQRQQRAPGEAAGGTRPQRGQGDAVAEGVQAGGLQVGTGVAVVQAMGGVGRQADRQRRQQRAGGGRRARSRVHGGFLHARQPKRMRGSLNEKRRFRGAFRGAWAGRAGRGGIT